MRSWSKPEFQEIYTCLSHAAEHATLPLKCPPPSFAIYNHKYKKNEKDKAQWNKFTEESKICSKKFKISIYLSFNSRFSFFNCSRVSKSLSDGGCSPSLTLFPCSSNMNSFIRRHFQITNKKEFLDKKHFRILLIYTITQILEAIFINQIYWKSFWDIRSKQILLTKIINTLNYTFVYWLMKSSSP